MNTSVLKVCLLGLLAAGIAGTSATLRAQNTNEMAVEKSAAKIRKPGIIPFHGNLKAVDDTGRTITVRNLTIRITPETRIQKAGKPATLQDGVVGEVVSGGYRKMEDGTYAATTVHFGPKEGRDRPAKRTVEGDVE